MCEVPMCDRTRYLQGTEAYRKARKLERHVARCSVKHFYFILRGCVETLKDFFHKERANILFLKGDSGCAVENELKWKEGAVCHYFSSGKRGPRSEKKNE